MPSVLFSWSSFNLRVGAGYGSIFLHKLGLIFPQRSIVPGIEAYFPF